VSEYEKINDISFTLNTYCTVPMELQEIPSKYQFEKKVLGKWDVGTAGGSSNNNTFNENPQYCLTISEFTQYLIVKLMCQDSYSVNVALTKTNGGLVQFLTTKNLVTSSGDYRKNFCFLEAKDLEPGSYMLVASTFQQNQLGNFLLSLGASTSFTLERIL
jgi:hypothetical protein